MIAGLAAVGAAVVVAAGFGARPILVSVLSHRLGRPVRAEGPVGLAGGPSGVIVTVERLSIGRPGAPPLATLAHARATLPWGALLGEGRLLALEIDGLHVSLVRTADGQANWSAAGRGGGAAGRLPRIDRLRISDGVVDLDDRQRAVSFHGTLATDAGGGRADGQGRLRLQGGGLSERLPWSMTLTASPSLGGPRPDALTLRLALKAADGPATLSFEGALASRGGVVLDGRLASAGPDLHDLAHLTDMPLFRTPPYALQARVVSAKGTVRLIGMTGRIGASDLEGEVAITPHPGGRRLEGRAHSRSLRISDLFAVVSGGQLTAPHAKGRLLPDARIDPAPLRKLTGELAYAADSVQAPTTPTIRSLRLHATFDHGRLGAEPMTMTLARGVMTVRFVLDVRGATPKIAFDDSLRQADLAEFASRAAAAPPLQAVFDARARLHGDGGSLSAAAAHASGDMTLTALSGRLQRSQADVLSARLVDGLMSLLSKPQTVPLTCAVADFRVADGVARAERLRIATPQGSVVGSGTLDLGRQSLDLTFRGQGGAAGVTAVRFEGPVAAPRTSLTLRKPTGLIGFIRGLGHAASPVAPVVTGCG